MDGFPVAVSLLQLRLRHARSLKDKRQVIQGLMQKLKNIGFSVTEVSHQDNPKLSDLGLAFAARDGQAAARALAEAERFMLGEFEVLGNFSETMDYQPDFTAAPAWYTGTREDFDDE